MGDEKGTKTRRPQRDEQRETRDRRDSPGPTQGTNGRVVNIPGVQAVEPQQLQHETNERASCSATFPPSTASIGCRAVIPGDAHSGTAHGKLDAQSGRPPILFGSLSCLSLPVALLKHCDHRRPRAFELGTPGATARSRSRAGSSPSVGTAAAERMPCGLNTTESSERENTPSLVLQLQEPSACMIR
ncbi:hypothetical protein BU16DRAFT_608331 [Lophium mytilinum]|uniref:Uncharacterized protein n=1 Tax=Lophium mytilinum TaxID=390894 RepID=A0A6A6QTT3_9PEZI|nr:hypothetical protein BU16DRAFT_608331 [Lophium mytilinum]